MGAAPDELYSGVWADDGDSRSRSLQDDKQKDKRQQRPIQGFFPFDKLRIRMTA
jgi:hypothetical protein